MAARTVAAMRPDEAGGPPPDFDRLYRDAWWPMVRVAYGLVGDRGLAEDVVQDAFSAVYRRWDGIRDRQAAMGYLRTAVVNAARSALRRRRTARRHMELVVDDGTPGADDAVLRAAAHAGVLQAMRQLPDRQREVLTLRFLADLSDADIARATGLSPGGVRSASSRGLAALRNLLGGQP